MSAFAGFGLFRLDWRLVGADESAGFGLFRLYWRLVGADESAGFGLFRLTNAWDAQRIGLG